MSTNIPRVIIAYNLPTFADHYKVTPVKVPSHYTLMDAATRIINALDEAGFKIVEVDSQEQPKLYYRSDGLVTWKDPTK